MSIAVNVQNRKKTSVRKIQKNQNNLSNPREKVIKISISPLFVTEIIPEVWYASTHFSWKYFNYLSGNFHNILISFLLFETFKQSFFHLSYTFDERKGCFLFWSVSQYLFKNRICSIQFKLDFRESSPIYQAKNWCWKKSSRTGTVCQSSEKHNTIVTKKMLLNPAILGDTPSCQSYLFPVACFICTAIKRITQCKSQLLKAMKHLQNWIRACKLQK